MKSKNLREIVRFSSKAPVRSTLYETERLWSELICLEGNQQVGPLGDPSSDAVCTVVAGDVIVQLGRARKRLSQWGTVLVPAETELHVTNATEEPAVVFLVAAPPPEGAVEDGLEETADG
jgi:quercetin dioxygenase-like cupin family protein